LNYYQSTAIQHWVAVFFGSLHWFPTPTSRKHRNRTFSLSTFSLVCPNPAEVLKHYPENYIYARITKAQLQKKEMY
jgi:hypothetical protein